MKKRPKIGRCGLIAVTCLLLFISSFISNYKISEASTPFEQYDCTTWKKVKDDVTYSVDILEKTKTRVSFTVNVYNESGTTASFDVKKSKIAGRKATFKYTDSWGNKGKGTIYFGNKTMYLKLTQTKQDASALWGVGDLAKCKFKLVSNNFS